MKKKEIYNIRIIFKTLIARKEKELRMYFGIEEKKIFRIEKRCKNIDIALKIVKINKNVIKKFKNIFFCKRHCYIT